MCWLTDWLTLIDWHIADWLTQHKRDASHMCAEYYDDNIDVRKIA